MTECTKCKYFIKYNKSAICLMKNDFQIVNGRTIFPKNCKNFYDGSKV